MTKKKRSSGQTAVSISLPAPLLREIDRRAEALGLNRSQYLSFLAKRDLQEKGDLTLREGPPEYRTSNSKTTS